MASTEKKTNPIQGMGPGSEDAVDYTTGQTYNGISREETEGSQEAKRMARDLEIDAHLDTSLAFSNQVGKLEGRLRKVEAILESMQEKPSPAVDTITATMVGGTFNCPECGLRITSPALIKTQGLKAGGYYEHPFDESPRLNGGKCRLIGKKFESPSIVLKMIQPKPAPKVDVAETIGV